MQYHLDGFRPGDPGLHPAAPGRPQPGSDLPAKVDVLIVGSGPAGLTLAAQLAAFPEITTRIVERRDGPLERGQADGISCRSMEMFAAFGLADRIIAEGYHVSETTFWQPDPADPARIARSGRVQDVEDGLSEMPHIILNQARVHDLYLDLMARSPSRLAPDYGRRFAGLTIDPAGGTHPVSVTLERFDAGHEGRREELCARYVVGCDGARSAVRRAIGRELAGDSANQAWGVMDVLAVTDFPDIRFKCLIQSAGAGNMLVIPREGGYLVRLYIELGRLAPGERIADRAIGLDQLIDGARRILHPYSLAVKDVVWWSVYEIGQRLTDRFDDLPAAAGPGQVPRVFIAGDACHTHSPKAGQGMNVSMGDAFNLGWKLALVLRGLCRPAILRSYSDERQKVAQDLIDFDRDWARTVSARPSGAAGTAPGLLQETFVRQGRITAGLTVTYQTSALVGPADWQGLAPGLAPGARLHSAPVLRLADARQIELGRVIRADGRWRLIAFSPDEDPALPDGALARLCAALAAPGTGPVARLTPAGADPDAVLDLRAVLPRRPAAFDPAALPALLAPRKGRLGLIDYEKVFCADPRPGRDIFDLRGVDRRQGCLVVVRPDQHVAHLLPLAATDHLAAFLDGIFLPPG